MKYKYCVDGDYLVSCNENKKEEYYTFEYTKDLQLIVSRCDNSNCEVIDVDNLNLKFDLPEVTSINAELQKLSEFRNFLQKYNIKVF